MTAPHLQDCQVCDLGVYRVVHTKVVQGAGIRVRTIACGNCGHSPNENKISVPLSQAPAQRSKRNRLSFKKKRIF